MKHMENIPIFKATLILPFTKTGKVILGKKSKHSKIGANCRNGYGGGIEEGENILPSAQREFGEESKATVEIQNLEYVAFMKFHNTKADGTQFICELWVFLLKDEKWEGTITETKEMLDPKEYDPFDLPLDEMMPADRDWMPLVMEGEKIVGMAYYGPFQRTLLKTTEIQVVKELHL